MVVAVAYSFPITALEDWAYRGVFSSTVFDRGPVENVFIQSFNGCLRDECLNARQFI
jgi:hypothetical protein